MLEQFFLQLMINFPGLEIIKNQLGFVIIILKEGS